MARAVKGEALQYRSQMRTWAGRVRGYPAGQSRGRWLGLGTDDKALAQQRYDRWLATGEPPKEAREETFQQAAERIIDAMPEATATAKKKKHDRGTRLRTYAYAILGQVDVWRIEPHHVASVLDRMPGLGKLKGTIHYVRTDLSQVFAALVREGARLDNPALGMKLPLAAVEDGRLRQVLTDEEVLAFRAFHGFETELDIACLLCRDVGGQRTSDLLACRWEHFDFERGTLEVRRPKTDTEGKRVTTRRIKSYELVTHGLPITVRAALRLYWENQGHPATGPVFTVQKPCRGGVVTRKDGSSYERKRSQVGDDKSRNNVFTPALRRALWRAKIYRPLPGWDPGHPDKGLCSLQTDTDETRAADFHSMRRAFVTALKSAGVPTADVLALAGHTQLVTSNRYDTARLVQVPDAALPRPTQTKAQGMGAPSPPGGGTTSKGPCPAPTTPDFAAIMAQLDSMRALLNASQSVPVRSIDPESGSMGGLSGSGMAAISLESLVEPTGIEPVTCALRMQNEPVLGSQVPVSTQTVPAVPPPAEALSTQTLGRMIGAAAMAEDWALVDELNAIARRRSAAQSANVHKLDDARKRRR